MFRKIKFALSFLAVAALLVSGTSFADSTAVLPQGRSSISLSYFQNPITREFDNSGSDRELGYYFNKIDVTAIGTPVFNNLFSLPAGTPSLNLAMIFEDSRVDAEGVIVSYSYGLTDKLTFGVGFPYFIKARTKINFEASAWPNTGLPIPLPPGPLDLTEQAQQFIKQQLGYDRVEDFDSGPGIGDIRIVLKYLMLDTDKVDAAGSVSGVIPTGRVDDEKNLTDIRYGNGHSDLGVAGMLDIKPIDLVTWNLTGRYVYTFPYHRAIFVQDPQSPFYDYELATKREFGDYDTGDYYELETELTLNLAEGAHVFGGFLYHQAWEERLDGDRVPRSEKMYRTLFYGLSADTTRLFLNDEAGLPVILSIHRDSVLSGKNVTKDDVTFFDVRVIF